MRPRIGAMIRRIDLRGASRRIVRGRLPRSRAPRRLRRRSRGAGGARDLRGGPHPRARRDPRVSRALRRRPRRRHPGAAGGAGDALDAARPGHPRRPRGVDPPAAARPVPPSSSRTRSPTSAPGARVTHRKVPVGRVGPLRARRAGAAGLERADERRARADRRRRVDRAGHPARRRTSAARCTRRSWRRARCSASRRSTPSAAPRRSRCSPTASGPCAKVDLVTGPGNIYVVTAKRILKGQVGIDSEAGPTEIAILADDTADAAYVAADLISQAEHDPLAAAVLVTTSEALADDVDAELDKQVSATKHVDRIRTSLGGAAVGRRPRRDLEQGLAVVDAYAAEHLEIHTADAAAYAARVRNAGAIFVGPYAPVSLGDYCAGSNHVLPTGGCACHSSGLSVRAFTKSVHVVDYSRGGARRGRRPRRHAGRGRGPARPRRRGPRAVRGRVTRLPAAPPRAARDRAVRRAAARRARPAQRQREPLRAVATSASPTSRPRSAEAARTLNRYPDREFVELRTALAAYLSRDVPGRHHPGAGVGGQRVQRGDAAAAAGVRRPGPHGAELRADVLDVSGVRPRHRHRLGRRAPRGRLLARPRPRPRAGRGASGPPSCCCRAPTTRPAPRCRRRRSPPCARPSGDGVVVVVDEAYGEFRRAGMPSALELLPAHRNLVVTRTMSKAFALAGAAARLPRRRPGDLRRDPGRAAALPPVRGHPGGRAGGAAARSRAARQGRRAARRARQDGGLAARPGATRSPTATPISACSAPSGIVMLSGRDCSTGAS